MKTKRIHTKENAGKVQSNVQNMPITSIALAGLLGAGVMAIMSKLTPK